MVARKRVNAALERAALSLQVREENWKWKYPRCAMNTRVVESEGSRINDVSTRVADEVAVSGRA